MPKQLQRLPPSIQAPLLVKPPVCPVCTQTAGKPSIHPSGLIFGLDEGLPESIKLLIANTATTVETQVHDATQIIDPFVPIENLVSSAVVLGTMLSTWFFTYFRWSIGWYLLFLMMLGEAYRRNQIRLKRKITKEFVKQSALVGLNDNAESVEWLNLLFAKIWTTLEPELSLTIKDTIDSSLEASKPAFLSDLRLIKFTLGSNAPRIDSLRTYPAVEADTLMMDLDLSFTPFDDDDLSERDRANSGIYNFYMELQARIGAGAASIPLPVLLKEFEIAGVLRLQLKFISTSPYIGMVDFGFLQVPRVDFVLRPLKGMDLKDIPGLSTFLQDTIDSVLRSAIVNPNKISINMVEETADRPIGVFCITIFDAKALKNVDITGTSDPCAAVIIGGKEVARTKVIDNNLFPSWNETFHVVVHKSTFTQLANHSDELQIDVWHINPLQKKLIGSTPTVRLQRWVRLLDAGDISELPLEIADELKKDPYRPMTRHEHDWLISNWGIPLGEPSEVTKQLMRPGSDKRGLGEIRFDMAYYPIPETPPEIPIESRSGVLSITVHQAIDLGAAKTACPECSISMDGTHIASTSIKKHTNNPTWNYSWDTYCHDFDTAKLKFVVSDRGAFLGECTTTAKDLVAVSGKDDWFKLFRAATGKIRITAKFIPVDMVHSSTDTSKVKRKEPCAVLRINIRKAEALANVEVLRKSDPYVNLYAGGKFAGATHFRKNTLDPEWNEIFYCVIWTPADTVHCEVFDWNELRDDKKLGQSEIGLNLLLPENPHLGSAHKQSHKAAETLDALTNDGLVLTPKSPSSVSVRAPIYISKNDNAHSTGEQDASHTDSDDAQSVLASTTKKSKFLNKDMFRIKPKQKTNQPRQQGHIYFDVEYFPVLKDLSVKPAATPRNSTTAMLPGIAHEAVVFRTRSSDETHKPSWFEAADKFVTDMSADKCSILIRQQVGEKQSASDFILGIWRGEAIREVIGRSFTALPIRQYTEIPRPMDHLPYVGHLCIEFSYMPVDIHLDAGSRFNSGILNVDIVSASNIAAGDSNGKCNSLSDPYCIVNVNGTTVHKTKVHKKTLNPVFNETVRTPIKSRLRSTLEVQVIDWDAIGGHDALGRVLIHLLDLPTGEAVSRDYPIEDGRGTLKLNLFFEPKAIHDSDASKGDAELRVNGGSGTGLNKFYKGLSTTFSANANVAANTFMSGFKRPSFMPGSQPSAPPKTSDIRYGLEGGERRPGSSDAGSRTLADSQSGQVPVAPVVTPASDAGKTLGVHPRSLRGPPNRTPSPRPATDAAVATGMASEQTSDSTTAGSVASMDTVPITVSTLPTFEVDHVDAQNRGQDQPVTVRRVLSDESISSQRSESAEVATAIVTLQILGARNLFAADSNGFSDPYVKVIQSINGKPKTLLKTSVIKKTLSPVWSDEIVQIQVPPSTVTLSIKDHNLFKGSVDLGHVMLDFMQDGVVSPTAEPVDMWYAIEGGQGELHLKFSIAIIDSNSSDSASIVSEKKRGLFGMRKPSVPVLGSSNNNGGAAQASLLESPDHPQSRRSSGGFMAGLRNISKNLSSSSNVSASASPTISRQESAESISAAATSS
eukprot:jgi/Hompol1/1119/HPOL_002644-RA